MKQETMSIREFAGLAQLLSEEKNKFGIISIRIGSEGAKMHVEDARAYGKTKTRGRGETRYPFEFYTKIGDVKIFSVHKDKYGTNRS